MGRLVPDVLKAQSKYLVYGAIMRVLIIVINNYKLVQIGTTISGFLYQL